MPKKQIYNIKMNDGTTKQVEGEVVNGVWGIDKRVIPYGKMTNKEGVEKTLSYTDYHITYIPTGQRLPLGTTRTIKNAKLLLSQPEFFFEELTPDVIKKLAKATVKWWEDRWFKD